MTCRKGADQETNYRELMPLPIERERMKIDLHDRFATDDAVLRHGGVVVAVVSLGIMT